MIEARMWQGITDSGEWHEHLFAQKGTLVFDIGANGGLYARKWAETFDRVVACEPNPHSYEALVEGLPDNVKALNVAVTDHEGTVSLFTGSEPHDNSGQFVSAALLNWSVSELVPVELPATTLDALYLEYGLPDVVKIDTEGHEAKVLEGAENLINRGTRFLIEVHSHDLGNQCREYLDGYDIEMVYHSAYKLSSEWRDNHYYFDAAPPSQVRET